MLQNAYFFAKIGADTAENEQHLAKICQPTLSDVSDAEVGPVGRVPILPPADDGDHVVLHEAPAVVDHPGLVVQQRPGVDAAADGPAVEDFLCC